MKTRRTFLMMLTGGLMATLVLAIPALAAELLGRVKDVDAAAKKIVVVEKGTNKDVDVTITDQTTYELPNGKTPRKFDIEKLKKRQVAVTHENGVASKIVLKKGAPKAKKGAGKAKKKVEAKP
jgi:hypothetical protein